MGGRCDDSCRAIPPTRRHQTPGMGIEQMFDWFDA
jgi:hypothetical protein